MRLVFSSHALKRCYERNINQATIRRIILNPDSRHDSFDDRIVVYGNDRERRLKVVYEQTGRNKIYVVTVIHV